MLWIILWIACMVVGALIYQSKNRPPINGAVICAVFGILGVLFVACQKKLSEPDDRLYGDHASERDDPELRAIINRVDRKS